MVSLRSAVDEGYLTYSCQQNDPDECKRCSLGPTMFAPVCSHECHDQG